MIETACAICQRPLVVGLIAGGPPGGRPERLWLADGGDDLRTDFCAPTVLLCSEDHARAWAVAQGGRGKALDLITGSDLAAAAWAPCAAAAS